MAAISQTMVSNAFSWMKKYYLFLKISLKFVVKGSIKTITALVQIMTWCCSGNKSLSELLMISLLMHICVIQPQKSICINLMYRLKVMTMIETRISVLDYFLHLSFKDRGFIFYKYSCLIMIYLHRYHKPNHLKGFEGVFHYLFPFIWHPVGSLNAYIQSGNHWTITERGMICKHMRSKVWEEITCPFPNSNGGTIEVWEWIISFHISLQM